MPAEAAGVTGVVISTSDLINLSLLATAVVAVFGLLVLLLGLQQVFRTVPQLDGAGPGAPASTSLSVVIPAYNEAHNIADCIEAVLGSEAPATAWNLVVVDDNSSDDTAAIAVAASGDDPRFSLLQAGPRPQGERWVGKNWACSQAVQAIHSEWLLFIDADVRLQPDAMVRALAQAIREQADLLSLAPRLSCGCLAEWMVQPIMASLLGLGFPIVEANNPHSPVAFAAGPFMLFRSSAYNAIGGHQAVAAEVVEDLALARRIKSSGYTLRYLLGLDAVDLRMYSNLSSLWEGWTKNWFLGLEGNVAKALGAAAVVVLMFSVPWLLLPISAISSVLQPNHPVLVLSTGGIALLGVGLQLALRLWIRARFAVPLTNWWLMGAGGLLIGAIGPVSVWRTLTGRGWTWKGRSLATRDQC